MCIGSLDRNGEHWKPLIFSLKAYLNKLLVTLYAQTCTNEAENCAHFTKLEDQSFGMIGKSDPGVDSLAFEAIKVVLNTRREELSGTHLGSSEPRFPT